MVDLTKRTILKTIGGVTAVAATPGLASAITDNTLLNKGIDTQSAKEIIVPINGGAEISIALSVDAETTLQLSNNSNQAVTVKHIHPGIINAGAQSFDINAIFSNGPRTIKAGETQSVSVLPMAKLQAETPFPRERYRNQPQRIASVTGKDHIGEIVNSTRSFYS
jgi:hypothetical protein